MKDLAAAAALLVLLGAVWLLLALHKAGAKEQPVQYNHKKHIELGLECGQCHSGIAEGRARAGLPGVETCAACHASDDADPKLRVLRGFISENRPIPWKRVYRVPEHVYFSHRRHAGLASLDCAVCHGEMAKLETPVARQAVPISMGRCVACHRSRGVTNDCLACHR